MNPIYPNALNNIGLIYFYYEENKKAYECFNKALKIDPEMIDLYFNMGDAYFKDRKFKEAREWYDKGFKIDILGAYAWELNGIAIISQLITNIDSSLIKIFKFSGKFLK